MFPGRPTRRTLNQLQLGSGFSFGLLVAFLFGSSILCLASVGVASWLAGLRGLEIVNLAVAENARGGPGIVLASVAYEAGIINGRFFTTLVLTAVLTSQAAGYWLGYVLRKGWPLLSEEYEEDLYGRRPAQLRRGESINPSGSIGIIGGFIVDQESASSGYRTQGYRPIG